MNLLLISPFPLSLIVKIFLFFIVARTTQAAPDNENYALCGAPYNCGPNNPDIKYPFYQTDRPFCGVPGFEITCQHDMHYSFQSGSQSFNILNMSESNHTMTIAQADLFPCPKNLVDTTIEGTLFNYSSSTENITLYPCPLKFLEKIGSKYKIFCDDLDANSIGYSSQNPEVSECRDTIKILVLSKNFRDGGDLMELLEKGFEVNYVLDETKLQMCNVCQGSGGICGTDTSSTTDDFICFCKDGSSADQSCPENKSKVARYIGIGVSTSVIGLLLLIIGLWCYGEVVKEEISKRRKEKFFKLPLKTEFKQNGGLLMQQQLSLGDGNIKKITIFKSYELEKATNNYSVDRVLGQGGQGTVYKGILSNGKLVAVKKSKIVDTKNIGQFVNEVVILSQINHRNIVKLLGCCLETEVPMLVYEFISNGTLYQQIHNPNEEFMLNWEMRLRIAAEIAGTLSYLHNAAPMPIFHRDIKSTNILLDDKYRVKVTDFGISRSVDIDISHLTTLVRGTFGYLDPEYYQSSRFTEKSDVYSFGVVLVELLTSKKPILSNTNDEYLGLAPYFLESIEENHLLEMIDPQLPKEEKIEEIVEVAHLAKACLNQIGKRRPTMKEVAFQLEGIKMSREQTTVQENGENGVREAHDDSSIATESWGESSTTSR